jgi:hypothetical protein
MDRQEVKKNLCQLPSLPDRDRGPVPAYLDGSRRGRPLSVVRAE